MEADADYSIRKYAGIQLPGGEWYFPHANNVAWHRKNIFQEVKQWASLTWRSLLHTY